MPEGREIVLEGKVCFVSGAARGRGNGRAIALKFAQKGADVAVADIRYEESKSVADEIKNLGRKAVAVKMDVSIYNEVIDGFDQIKKELGDIDILVNNAAIMTNFATISNMNIEA
jgi:meso-butanediol dehydrogenase/(S,S)-butanediol dehydrogenase/diacetyl reductase